jgi:hypothetical protein
MGNIAVLSNAGWQRDMAAAEAAFLNDSMTFHSIKLPIEENTFQFSNKS